MGPTAFQITWLQKIDFGGGVFNFLPPFVPSDRKRILQYPALVSCTSIDWFCDWPKDALLEVAERYLEGMELGSKEGVRIFPPRQDL